MNVLNQHPDFILPEYLVRSNEMLTHYFYLEICVCKISLTAGSFDKMGFNYKGLSYDLSKGVQRS